MMNNLGNFIQQNYSLGDGEERAEVVFIGNFAPEGSQTEWENMHNAEQTLLKIFRMHQCINSQGVSSDCLIEKSQLLIFKH